MADADPFAKARAARAKQDLFTGGSAVSDPQAWCDNRNATLTRNGIEWFVDGGGQARLRYRDEASRRIGRAVAERRERERDVWMQRNGVGRYSDPRETERMERGEWQE